MRRQRQSRQVRLGKGGGSVVECNGRYPGSELNVCFGLSKGLDNDLLVLELELELHLFCIAFGVLLELAQWIS